MRMIIKPPCMITSRLLPGIKVGDATLSIEYSDCDKYGRKEFSWFVDVPGVGDFEGASLSGMGGLQSALGDLCYFLGHAGDWFNSMVKDPEDEKPLFPPALCEWAGENVDALEMVRMDLEEGDKLIQEDSR